VHESVPKLISLVDWPVVLSERQLVSVIDLHQFN
jgi:hypothetical protein